MSFSTGFKDGFGYYKAFSDMEQDKLLTGARLKTEELRQQAYQSDITESEETRDVRMEGIKAQSDFQVARAEKTRAETDEFIALADQRKESANLLLADRSLVIICKHGGPSVNSSLPPVNIFLM